MESADKVLTIKVSNIYDLSVRHIHRFQSQRFIFTLTTDKNKHKIFQVFYGNDGSLYVNFPYYENAQGLVALGSISPFLDKQDIDLLDTGKVTSHLVKYSHHTDGLVLFSQDGKVKSSIRKKSMPLAELNGHIFSILFRGLERFKEIHEKDYKDELKGKKAILNFDGKESKSSAFRVVARWYDASVLVDKFRAKEVGPVVNAVEPSGIQSQQFLIGPTKGNVSDRYVLAVSCFEDSSIDQDGDEFFIFLGGFDKRGYRDLRKREEFLIFKYPIEGNYDELKRQLGSIDFS